VLEDLDGRRVDPDDAVLVALAGVHADLAPLEPDVSDAKIERLGTPETGSVERTEEGSVAEPSRVAAGWLCEEACCFLARQRLREVLSDAPSTAPRLGEASSAEMGLAATWQQRDLA
jgi:hypothetical protein